MLGAERQRLLLTQLKSIGSLSIAESAKRFNVSEETIRRDLNAINKLVPLRRVYGGAYIQKGAENDAPLSFRQSFVKEEKHRIATECIKHIENNDIIMIDSSDTASYLARQLPELHYSLTVITNSLVVLEQLAEADDINVFCIGGSLRHRSKSFTGPDAINMLNNHVASKAFVSPSGVNADFGLTDYSLGECQIRRAMIERSKYCYLLADHTKLDPSELKGTNLVCDLSKVNCIITDAQMTAQWQEAFIKNKVDVIVV